VALDGWKMWFKLELVEELGRGLHVPIVPATKVTVLPKDDEEVRRRWNRLIILSVSRASSGSLCSVSMGRSDAAYSFTAPFKY